MLYDRGRIQYSCELLAVGRLEQDVGYIGDLCHDGERGCHGGIVGGLGKRLFVNVSV